MHRSPGPPSADTGPPGADPERRFRRGVYLRALLLLLLWPALGLGLMAWGFQMSDVTVGRALFFAGMALGNAGVIGTLLWAYHRVQR